MTGTGQSGGLLRDALRSAGIVQSTKALTPKGGSRLKRTGKTRSKMWDITRKILPQKPSATDADIKRCIRAKYGETVSDGIIQEARWIFKRKVESGEIVLPTDRVKLSTLQSLYNHLEQEDKDMFHIWLAEQIQGKKT